MSFSPVNFSHLINQLNRLRLCLEMPEVAELPLAKPGDTDECVIAVALSNGWKCEVASNLHFRWTDEGEKDLDAIAKAMRAQGFTATADYKRIDVQLTRSMSNFIEKFDRCEFPHLMDDDSLKQAARNVEAEMRNEWYKEESTASERKINRMILHAWEERQRVNAQREAN